MVCLCLGYNLACVGTFYDGCGAMMYSKCQHYSKAIVTQALTSTTAISIVQNVYMSNISVHTTAKIENSQKGPQTAGNDGENFVLYIVDCLHCCVNIPPTHKLSQRKTCLWLNNCETNYYNIIMVYLLEVLVEEFPCLSHVGGNGRSWRGQSSVLLETKVTSPTLCSVEKREREREPAGTEVVSMDNRAMHSWQVT